MTDTITESFCERCGTQYSFEPPPKRRGGGIGRIRVVTRGLRNFVANDGMPMDEAMAAARNDEERAGISRQLDAFHRTFNFCMSCRQYTCPTCWNEKAGECLSCAPDLTRDVLPAPFPDLPLGGPVEAAGPPDDGRAGAASAWPTADLAGAVTNGGATTGPGAGGSAEEQEVLARLEGLVAAPSGDEAEELTAKELEEVEGALAAQPAAEEPAAEEPVARATAARVQTRRLLGRFRPAHRPAAPAGAAAVTSEPASSPPVPTEPEPQPALTDVGPELAAAPAPPEPATEPATQPGPDPVPPRAVEPPIWRVVAPDLDPPSRPGEPHAPAWPASSPPGSEATHVTGAAAAPWAARLATARPDPGGVWAASSQELLTAPGAAAAGRAGAPAVQACVSCGLSLSANARFCRRCGARQA
ncbi:MAG TPA: hypothetical protein VLM76_00300 [Patescibacteria group bacterium]|nr:hypothetical protein [Patescibacteria group bacterium]